MSYLTTFCEDVCKVAGTCYLVCLAVPVLMLLTLLISAVVMLLL